MTIIEETNHEIFKKVFEKRKEHIIPGHKYLADSHGQ
jgi:hypothetical protein